MLKKNWRIRSHRIPQYITVALYIIIILFNIRLNLRGI